MSDVLLNFFLAVLGLRCCAGAFSSERGGSSLWYAGFSLQGFLLSRSTGYRCVGYGSWGALA